MLDGKKNPTQILQYSGLLGEKHIHHSSISTSSFLSLQLSGSGGGKERLTQIQNTFCIDPNHTDIFKSVRFREVLYRKACKK